MTKYVISQFYLLFFLSLILSIPYSHDGNAFLVQINNRGSLTPLLRTATNLGASSFNQPYVPKWGIRLFFPHRAGALFVAPE